MNRKNIYLILTILGLVGPYYFFLQMNGFDANAFFQHLSEDKIWGGLAMDLFVSVIVFWTFMLTEAGKLGMKNVWVYFLAIFAVGLSFALPLFLYFRERALEHQ